ncbi:hypothetical protein GCM10009733_008210 [Nonomuraea maheshkhaliensis]|uniref:Uncharacterized protein n=1 Tax=Nonomuraea maheshkhaliensis TaxID=419590 RepID=A0ABN2EU69_9ACTN
MITSTASSRSMTTRHLPIEVLNSGPYITPDALHSYPTTTHASITHTSHGREEHTVTVVHIAGCPLLKPSAPDTTSSLVGEWVGTGLDMHRATGAYFYWCNRCMSHRYNHVVLPDHTRRYRPAGSIGVWEARDLGWAEWAVAVETEGGWQVLDWTVLREEADRAAAAAATKPQITATLVLSHRDFPSQAGT